MNAADLLNDSNSSAASTLDDLLAGLDSAPEDAPYWKGEKAGDTIAGRVTATDSTTSEYTTDPIPVVYLETDGGGVQSVTAFHTTLRNDIKKLNLQVGDLLAIRYEGKKQTKDGKREFHAYTVRHARG